MTKQTYKCTECDAEFASGNYFGCFGNSANKHKVVPITYYSPHPEHMIGLKPDTTMMDGHGARITIGGLNAHFKNGLFVATDPEQQDIIAKNGYGLLTKEQYTEMNLTTEQKNARLRTMLDEKDTLLEKAKQDAERYRQQAEAKAPAEQREPEVARAGRR